MAIKALKILNGLKLRRKVDKMLLFKTKTLGITFNKFRHKDKSDFEIGVVYSLGGLHIHLGYLEYSIQKVSPNWRPKIKKD